MENKVFYAEKSPYGDYFMIKYNEVVYKKLPKTKTSYNILPCRLFELPYHEYLKYVRDRYNAEICFKNKAFPYIIFKNEEDAKIFAKELSRRWRIIVKSTW